MTNIFSILKIVEEYFSTGRAFSGNLGCQFFKNFHRRLPWAPLVDSNQVYTNLVWVRFRTISYIYSTGVLQNGKTMWGNIKGGGGILKRGTDTL